MRLQNYSENMEVLYPGNLALLSMFLKNPENNSTGLKKDGKKKDGECADVLTCGMCQKDFLLADILRFIQHKVTCQASIASGCRTEKGLSPRESESPTNRLDHNGDLHPHDHIDPSSSPKNLSVDVDDSKTDDKRKRDDEDDFSPSARKKARSTQDAEANTVDSEPTRHMCGTCGTLLGSAWQLVQHVQSSHGIIIYQESPGSASTSTPSTPPALPRPSHSSPLSSVSSTAPTVSLPSPHLHIPLIDPTKVDLSKVDLTKVDLSKMDLSKISGNTHLPPHPPVSAPLLDPNHPFNLLRMPLGDGRTPFPPGLAPHFVRPGHDFRMEQILHEGLRLNPNLIPPHFERPPFLDPGLGAPRSSAPTPLSSGGDPNLDFYSQRLRQLAGTTSPTSSTSPRKPLPTPPPSFSSPNGPTPSSNTAPQTPTSTKVGTSTSNEKRFRCECCNKGFKWETNLWIHQRIHTGEKDFRCHKCDEILPTAQKLRSHVKLHMKSISQSGASPDSSRPATEDEGEIEEEEIEEEEAMDEEEVDDEEHDSNPSGMDSLDDEEDDNQADDTFNEGPEDLSTTKSYSITTSQNVTSSTFTEAKPRSRPDQQKSVVGELMDKFGLANISAYSEAYQQALKESGRLMGHHIGRDGNKVPLHQNGIEKTLKLRDDLAKGIANNHHPSLDLAHQTLLGAFDNPYDVQKRMNSHRGENGLYAGLWLPSLSGTPPTPRDLFPGMPHNDNNMLPHKLISENAMKIEPQIPKPGVSSASVTPLSLIHQTKKESKRNDTCEFCGKIFKNCSNLTVHRRSHTGEKPYKCDLCSYACAQSSKLTRHMKTHGRLGKDVYRCRFCDMPFSVASTLEKHMRKCVVNQNGKGLFPSISVANHDSIDSYKGLHFSTPIMSDDSKPSPIFPPHFSPAVPPVSTSASIEDSKPNNIFSTSFTSGSITNTSTDDTGDSSNLSGPGS